MPDRDRGLERALLGDRRRGDARPNDPRSARARGRGQPRERDPGGDPLGGHFVQGHVDAVGRIASVDDGRVWVEAAPEILRYCVEKGSITVDGVSLTIAALRGDAFEVALIPHTLEVTTLGAVEPGDEVNLEVDMLAKYVEKLIDRDTISG